MQKYILKLDEETTYTQDENPIQFGYYEDGYYEDCDTE